MTKFGPSGRSAAQDTRGRVSRYRVELPKAEIFQTEGGRYEATALAERRHGWKGRYLGVRDAVLGSTLSNARLEGERLSKIKALAVFSSDALSSVAYATQEIMFVLILAGSGAMGHALPIATAIVLLLGIVVISYRQTIRAYPSGGGAYIVAHENLGIAPGLIAASALLIDYVLTVAVSIAAGVDALASLNESFRPVAVELAVGLVIVVALINLRGMKESGTIFAIPTYAFVITLGAAIAVALVKILADGGNPLSAGTPREPITATEGLTIFLILKAFANGCAAMTGVEAVSNGVQAFKRPSAENANKTLVAMALILGSLFLGVTIVARHHGFVPHEDNTIPAQLGAEAFGDGTLLFAFLQVMTAGILVLAANTAFADFPRLAAILARDGYMPRIFHARGNRLVFSTGIIVLSALACLLLVVFDAKTTRLIPLYAVGVFTSFTLSQAGMVVRWRRLKEQGWQRAAAINGFGALATGIVTMVILEAKFIEGAWVVVLVIPILASSAWLVGRFYRNLRRTLNVAAEAVLDIRPRGPSGVPVVVPVEEINLATVMVLGSACEKSRDVTAVHVQMDPDEPSTVEERWRTQFPEIPLVVIDSPYRTVADPIASYINDRIHEPPHEMTVMIPVIEVKHWYQRALVNQSLKRLRQLLSYRRQVQVVDVPFRPGGPGRRQRKASQPVS